MNNKQTNNFFIHSSLSGIFTALLQQKRQPRHFHQLIYASLTRQTSRAENAEHLAREIAAIARHACLAKQMDVVEQASQVMLALPFSEKLKGIATYYKALCMKQQGDVEGARHVLEQLTEGSMPQYRARALHNIGATYYESSKVDEALPFYLAAGRIAANCDLVTLAESQCMVAAIRGIQGNSRQAIADLERIFPLVRLVGKSYPAFYYDYLNNLAVEFGEAGRITEAEAAINIALASPYASVHPGWSETRDEIEQKRNYPDLSRCFVDRSLTESEVASDSIANTSVEVDIAIEPARATEAKSVRVSARCAFVGQSIYQRPVTLPNAVKATIPGGVAKSFLQRLGRSVQLRGPPAYSLF